MGRHEEQTENHPIDRWQHADTSERTGQSVVSGDLGKVSWQQDNDTLWFLSDTGPDWINLSGDTGATGPQGDTGIQGDTGDQGDTGADPAYLYQVYRTIASHTDTTWYSLFTDGASAQLLVPTDEAWTLKVLVIGLTSGAAERWAYELNGMVVNDGGTTTVVSGTPVDISESDAAYDVQLVADDGTDAVEVQVRRNGGSDYNIKWRATVITTEEVYA